MRIGIDARPLCGERAGVGNYVLGLVQHLCRIAPEHEFVLYSNREISHPDLGGHVGRTWERAFQRLPGSLWLLGRGASLAHKDQLDVFWATSPVLPLRMPRRVLTMVTVYDAVWLRFPETMRLANRSVHKLRAKDSIAAADLVLTISRSAQQELMQLLNIPTKKVVLAYPGLPDCYRPLESSSAAQYISSKYGVPSRYLACVGTIEPRKNLGLLVRMMQTLKAEGRLNVPLLIAGAKGWKNSYLFREIELAGLTEEDVRFMGYLPADDLPSFYAGAQAFLFPSVYEGFGLPPLEAMACGTPVIASDSPSMPEILGNAALLEPASSAERFAAAVKRVLSDEDLRRSMRREGIQRAASFRWGDSAKHLLEAIEQTLIARRSSSAVSA